MINNSIYPIIINVTLNDSLIGRLIEPQQPWWANINPVMAAIFGAIAAGLIQFGVEFWRNRRSYRYAQIQAHSDLLGCKHTILKYNKSYFISLLDGENLILNAKLISIHRINFTKVKDLLEANCIEDANQYATEQLK